MRQAYPPLLIGTVALAALAGGLWPCPAGEPVLGLPAPVPLSAFHLQGTASCAAMACHNANGPPGTRGSEYTTWATCDPHSRAFEVLGNERSRRIQEIRNSTEPEEKRLPAEKDQLCLRCHAFDTALVPPPEQCRVTDGVGCESCHGPAEKWRTLHYTVAWKALSPEQKTALGFTNTRNLVVRAEVCVSCHVGTGDQEVNHDLIAAGHPRLRFEYGAYLANYPRHWSEEEDKHGRVDFEERVWAIGQVISARASVELLESRASTPSKPWPEFAEYGCFSCHHDLSQPSWRQERGFGGRRPGSLPWGTWYFPLLPTLAQEDPARAPGSLDALKQLDRLMSNSRPNRQRVAEQARQTSALLASWAASLDRPECHDPKFLAQLLADLAGQQRLAEADWDSATQLYLALAAVYHALGDEDPPVRAAQPVKNSLHDLAAQLERAFPQEPVRYDSPRDFRPENVKQQLELLRQRLGQLPPR